MQYWTPEETLRLLKLVYDANRTHHLAILVGLTFGLRVSEVLAIRGKDVQDGQLSVVRLKCSRTTLQPVFVHSNPLIDCSPLLESAKANPNATGSRGLTR